MKQHFLSDFISFFILIEHFNFLKYTVCKKKIKVSHLKKVKSKSFCCVLLKAAVTCQLKLMLACLEIIITHPLLQGRDTYIN